MLAATPPAVIAAQGAAPPRGAFVSLVPACACARHTELDLFSASTGRMLRRVTTLGGTGVAGSNARLSPATDGGRLFLTVSTEGRCDTPKHEIYMECPRWVPDSCRNTVESLSAGQSSFSTAFTVAGSQEISDVVPDPAGNEVALTSTPCVSVHGTTGLFIRGLISHRTRAVVKSDNRCNGYSATAWNQSGTELAFVLSRAGGPPIRFAGGIGCTEGPQYLAVASGVQSSHPRLKLTRPDRGCIFRSVAFDTEGVLATEGCNRDSPPNEGGNHIGQAILVQYGEDRQVLTRTLLKPGLEDSELVAEPNGRAVLVTQDQPANSGYPPRDWVWWFDGRHLRPVAHYASEDADQILAIPW